VSLPNAEHAVVEIENYLLSADHPVGRFKAIFFRSLGYSADRWSLLRDDLLAVARSGTAVPGHATEFGQKYEIRATLTGPAGGTAAVTTVWIVRLGEDFPWFGTAFPR
jgi:hypothetical protein